MKLAVVLFNLGGPLQEADIKPFLFNFFMDKNIIGAPFPIRYLIAKYVSITRGRGAARDAYEKLGFRSPLLHNTQAQAQALEEVLGNTFPDVHDMTRVFVSMRYWEPTASDTVDALEDYAPDHVVLLPLYPQYSTTTTFSSFENFEREVKRRNGNLAARWGKELKVYSVGCYPLLDGFVEASAELIGAALQVAPAGTRLLFSAHGLPEKVIAGGDPYQFQCEAAAAAIAKRAGIAKDQWRICYQSRVGPLKWIGPSIQEELEAAARDNVGVAIYPHAFVSEHVETLVELDIEYRHIAQELGVPYYARVPTVSTHPAFIAGLSALVRETLGGEAQLKPCGASHARCGCRKEVA